MDLTASIMCMEQKFTMLVFALEEENSIVNTVHRQVLWYQSYRIRRIREPEALMG